VTEIARVLDQIAQETRLSGVVRVEADNTVLCTAAYGMAHRGLGVANTVDTRFGLASGTKGFTALAVMSLIEEGRLALSTTARSVLGDDLPLIGDDVAVEHLLAHRSGIGDYLDEDEDLDFDDYLLRVPAQELAATEQYLRVLDGFPAKFAAGERFSYCNSGYVILALIAERVAGIPFHDLVEQRVCAPAGMRRTAFLRADELPGDAAIGYLHPDGMRSNVFHLPVRGSGDGGIYSTAADIQALWEALFAGRIVSHDSVAMMIGPRSEAPAQKKRYGLGFWLDATGSAVILEGCDAGVSFRSVHDPRAHSTYIVLANTTDGAWPLARRLEEWR
jgi:CubicO group peptidase (beta-lactamase class C family)